MKKLRLGFHYHVCGLEKNGQIWMPGFMGRFIDSLANYCEEVVVFVHSPRADELDLMDYSIQTDNVKLVSIGNHDSALRRTLFSNSYTRQILPWRNKLDVLLIRGPSPLLTEMANAVQPTPVVLMLVGDYLTGIDELPQPFWRKELIRLWAHWNRWNQDRIAAKTLTFVNSHKLFTELQPNVPQLHEIRTTTLGENDLFYRSDTCQDQTIRLLFTGRLSVSKGLYDIVRAMRILADEGENITLDLVGWPEKREETIVQNLIKAANLSGLGNRVVYHGYKSVGPELFYYYRRADIFVVASPTSEGFPRTIWEAMSQCLPVVATRVGSIPAFIENAAELVDPGDPSSLAKGISTVIHSPERRKSYIEQGMNLARTNTMDKQVVDMINTIQNWIGKQQ